MDCGNSLEPPRRGGSNEYPQSMILSRNKKYNVYPSKPQFYYLKVGFKGGQNYIGMFSWSVEYIYRRMVKNMTKTSFLLTLIMWFYTVCISLEDFSLRLC